MKFFKPKDFPVEIAFQEEAAKVANAKLECESKRVYGINGQVWGETSDGVGFKAVEFNREPAKHKALLICIEPIAKPKPTYKELEEELFCLKAQINMEEAKKKLIEGLNCTHPKEKVQHADYEGIVWKCECGAKVQPKEFEEIK